MSGIGAVAPADKRKPIEERQPPERDGGKGSPQRRPREPQSDADLVKPIFDSALRQVIEMARQSAPRRRRGTTCSELAISRR